MSKAESAVVSAFFEVSENVNVFSITINIHRNQQIYSTGICIFQIPGIKLGLNKNQFIKTLRQSKNIEVKNIYI